MTDRFAIVYLDSRGRAISVVADFDSPEAASVLATTCMPLKAHGWTIVPLSTVYHATGGGFA